MALTGIEELLMTQGPKATAGGVVNDGSLDRMAQGAQEANLTSELLRLTAATEAEKKKAEKLLLEEEALKAKEEALSLELARLTQQSPLRDIAPASVETATDLRKMSEMEQRIAKLNETFQTDPFYQGSNISVSLVDGVPTFTNIAPRKNNETEPAFKPPMAKTEEADTIEHIRKSLQSVKDAPTIIDKETQAENFRRSAAELELKITNRALEAANAIVRPEIEQTKRQLEVARVNDQIARMQGLLKGDSAETTALLAKLDELDIKAKEKAKEIIDQSPELAFLRVEGENLKAYLQGEVSRQAKREIQDERAAATEAIKTEARQAKEQAEIDRAAPFLSKARVLFDDLSDKSDLEVARALSNKMLADKATAAALQLEGDDLLIEALNGNPQAKRLIARQEAQRRGSDEASILQSFANLEVMAENNKAIKDFLLEEIKDEQQVNDMMANLNPRLVTGAEAKAQAQAQRKSLALQAYRKQQEAAFISRLDRWTIQDPELAKITRELGENSSLPDVLKVYVGNSIGEERTRKIAVVAEAVRENGRLEAQSAITQLPAEFIAQNIETYLYPDELGLLARSWQKIAPYNPLAAAGLAVGMGLEAALSYGSGFVRDTIDEFASGNSFGTRADGTPKGTGFLGVLQRPDGGVSTELSVGVDLGDGEEQIPLLVPTLTQEEIDHLLSGKKETKAILDKAVAHARKRKREGKPVFATPSDTPRQTTTTGIRG